MTRKQCILFLLVAVTLLVPAERVSAIGITPSAVVFDFEPGLNRTVTYKLISAKDADLYVKGDLKDYVKLSHTTLKCPCSYTHFTAELALPEELERPGLYDTRVGAVERSPPGGGGIGAKAAIEALLWVKVPYPGRYAVIVSFIADNVKVGEPVHFSIKIESQGLENITGTLRLEIFDSDGNKVATLFSQEKFIETKKSVSIELVWKTEGVKEGIYTAKVAFDYAEKKPATASKDFRVGDILIKIVDILNNETIEGGIAKFVIRAESFWNSMIRDVYATLLVTKNGKTVGQSKSSNVDVEAWSMESIKLFWDTEDTESGTYNATITVHYHNKTVEKIIETKITPKMEISYIILIIAIIILAISIAVLMLYYKYKHKKRSKG